MVPCKMYKAASRDMYGFPNTQPLRFTLLMIKSETFGRFHG